ncbi:MULTISPECIES: glycosyltransferase [Aphanothece]|uniref:glycosyltransferase n=1 Tax=Aphanothece TaxID=1121 RepID=UPI00398556BD
MQICVDALAVTNLSGRRVLLGHLAELIAAHHEQHRFVVLHHWGNRDLIRDLGAPVRWLQCPGLTRHWTGRLLWQHTLLPLLLRRHHIDAVLSPTGGLTPATALPQIVLAQNPWCLVASLHRGPAARLKAALQRHAYRRAQRRARLLFCNSAFLVRLYARNAGTPPRPEPILANGIDEAIFLAAQPIARFDARLLEVLTVSVMAPHKAIELVVEAIALLRGRGVAVRLRLVGPWADASYRRRIERQIAALGLADAVLIQGRVSEVELHGFFRRARVFVLLSRCESFGLPAVEAQAFGTPSVVADLGAPPEIAGPGGLVVPPEDPAAAAAALQSLLCDANAWAQASASAVANAERFRWSTVSRPLVHCLEQWNQSGSVDPG